MNPKTAFIWDLDGTLLNSYGVIVTSIKQVYREFGLELDADSIHRYVIRHSGGSFIQKMEREHGIDASAVLARYSVVSGERKLEITLIEHAGEALAQLTAHGCTHYVYTHRGETTFPVLANLGIDGYFTEVLTSQSGFPRKPDGTAVRYLMEKYALDPKNTYYVGDRTLDMECAVNSGIPGILYLEPGGVGKPSGAESRIIHDLMELVQFCKD